MTLTPPIIIRGYRFSKLLCSAESFVNRSNCLYGISSKSTRVQYYYSNRTFCSEKLPAKQIAKKYSPESVRQNVQGYVFSRFFDYVKNYDKVLEKNFPSATKVYRLFFDGVREFYKDMKHYLKISRIAYTSPNGLEALTRKELELYLQMPQDMIKVAPALLLSALPFVGYAVFPLVYMYPKTFLTSHFWTIQQKSEFHQHYLKERLLCNRKVFRYLQAKLGSIKSDPLYNEWKRILGLLGSGLHPTISEILNIQDIFSKPPYHFRYLSRSHVKFLCQMHGINPILLKRTKLTEHAEIIQQMDRAIMREGDVHNMPNESLKHACFLRGLNPVNLSNENMIKWMRDWIKVSLKINHESHLALFVHLPILLGYNHPNNWKVVYNARHKSK